MVARLWNHLLDISSAPMSLDALVVVAARPPRRHLGDHGHDRDLPDPSRRAHGDPGFDKSLTVTLNSYDTCTTSNCVPRQTCTATQRTAKTLNDYCRRSPRVPLRLPCTSTPRPDRQVPRERLYLYRRRGSNKYPYNKCTSTVVLGIAKNVKYPFEMTRPTSSNDPKYLFEMTEYHYRRTLERLQAETSSSSMNHVRLSFLVDSPKYHEMDDPTSSTTVAVYDCRRHENDYFPQRTVNNYFLYHRRVPLLPTIVNDYTA
ncbi:hypothetical protein TRIUR3_33191 [Triticum urartu]|uniref:Uncharacterized protein n=1 Tax=Triticum urartu TaxID=4572 RepID=M8AF98_TRIUA|nr:hypothetical protein TRIUR3_33191 [Triticum urartu]